MQRLWVTIVNNETAEQALKRGKRGALMCAVLFGALAVDAFWFYRRQGFVETAFFALLYIFAAWFLYQGSDEFMDLSMICLPFGLYTIWSAPVMRPGGHARVMVSLFFLLIGFELLNGVRGVSYLHAPLGLPRRGGEDAEGGIGVGAGPSAPHPSQGAHMPESI